MAAVRTPLQVSGGATMEKLEKFGGDAPMGRAGQPAELASIHVQLADPRASYATGQVYGAAGGGGSRNPPASSKLNPKDKRHESTYLARQRRHPV